MHSTHSQSQYRPGNKLAEEKGRGLQTVSTSNPYKSASVPRPMFTVEESIVMRGVSGGKSDKQLCIELRMPLNSFQRLLRDLMGKTGTSDRIGLLVWALRQKQGADSRENDRDYKWRRPSAIRYE
jgi:DNA-binding NarL/FixJ family response regulator